MTNGVRVDDCVQAADMADRTDVDAPTSTGSTPLWAAGSWIERARAVAGRRVRAVVGRACSSCGTTSVCSGHAASQ